MTRNKKKKIAEILTFSNVIVDPHGMKGKWNDLYFNNTHPITLELGCGKGEYTVHLAEQFPDKNFIGIDLKGARIWRGALDALSKKLNNVAFLRYPAEQLEDCFELYEVSEIWIPFPDPYPKPCKARKRLLSPRYLNIYKSILVPEGFVHFKTDNPGLYDYTLQTIHEQGHEVIEFTDDLYNSSYINAHNSIPTYFENIFKSKGHKIKYIKFKFNALST